MSTAAATPNSPDTESKDGNHDHTAGHAPKIATLGDLAKVSLGALGIVYGDIGTSPLYAMKECFTLPHGVEPSRINVLGILSLFFWSLTLVIAGKYLTYIMRADNRGEGGILALLALASPETAAKKGWRRLLAPVLISLALFGAALLYGDGIITPAISVLGAVEGLGVATHQFDHLVVPFTVFILVLLFLFQKRGTAGIGNVFGPMMLIWFFTIAAIGVPWIIRVPEVLLAVNPFYAAEFIVHHRLHGFLVLGTVVLCITGGEALYADMGHFGKKPIRMAWYVVVLPSLLVNYFGQGALLLDPKSHVQHPFYDLVSGWMLFPLVAIATSAAVIASQALISGAFSITQQAVQLGYWPRVTIVHTSGHAEGQIYIPEINRALMVGCVALVLGFGSSSNLAAAYGIAVTGTMTITTVLFFVVAQKKFKWGLFHAGVVTLVFLTIDLAFLGANVVKIGHGGLVPLILAAATFLLMTTWKRGRYLLWEAIKGMTLPLDLFMEDLERIKPHRVRGTAVFMTSNPDGTPPVLLHHFKHNKVLHEQVVLLSIATEHVPEILPNEHVRELTDLGRGFFRVRAAYGFMQTPHVFDVLDECVRRGLRINRDDTSFFLGRETLIFSKKHGMARWRKVLFAFMSRNAPPANTFFQIPPNRVVELGTQVEL